MIRSILAILLVLSVLAGTGAFVLGDVLVSPQQQLIYTPSTELALESIEIPTETGHIISGWFVQGQRGNPGVLLLHSLKSNRMEMLARAEFINKAGYSVLLIDMQAHGLTPGERITFGYRESYDAHSALNYIRKRLPGQKVGVIGVSLGGAAALLGESPIDADALVLEAVYSSIGNAIENRMAIRLGEFGRIVAPLLEWQIQPRLGIAPESLAPISAIRNLKSPVLIIAGENDRHTLRKESKSMFRAASPPKELWLIEGAQHQNLHRYTPAMYQRRILAFFDKYLGYGNT